MSLSWALWQPAVSSPKRVAGEEGRGEVSLILSWEKEWFTPSSKLTGSTLSKTFYHLKQLQTGLHLPVMNKSDVQHDAYFKWLGIRPSNRNRTISVLLSVRTRHCSPIPGETPTSSWTYRPKMTVRKDFLCQNHNDLFGRHHSTFTWVMVNNSAREILWGTVNQYSPWQASHNRVMLKIIYYEDSFI